MTKEKEKGILLESGTNELEIATFKVGKGLFAINVAKIQSIETQLKTTKIPNSHDHVKGIVNHRGNILPVINLSKVLGEEFELQEADRQVIVAFFNEKGFAFEIDKVMGINRLSWKDVETPSELYSNSSLVTGVIKLDDKIILSVDFEKIVVSLSGKEYNQGMEKLKEVNKEKLAGKQIIVAEDSPFLSKIISDSLGHTGAEVSMFNNGEDALQ
ncbi:MAG: purine-binding chemotaxis protein CheW, partial [Tindallia sp. MSAO_Bac2]